MNTITIDLSNLMLASQVKSVGQNVSDLYFTLDNTTSIGWVLSNSGGDYPLNGLGAARSGELYPNPAQLIQNGWAANGPRPR